MKAKTIKAIISKKCSDWWESIEDEQVRELVKANTIVTGGCIPSMLLREKVSDFDVYLRSKETVLAVAHYYVKRFEVKEKTGIPCKIWVEETDNGRVKIMVKSSGIASEEGTKKPYEYFEGAGDEGAAAGYVAEVMQDPGAIEERYEETEEKALEESDEDKGPKYRPVFLSTNAITLSNKVQIILRFYGEPEEIHRNYDFDHCKSYWTSWDKQLVLPQAALESLLTKELRYTGSLYPVCSIFRTRKFISRGWTINAGQMLKMAMQVSALDLTDINVLEDQLTGVDVAYFMEVIEKMREKGGNRIDTAYLIEIIDRMF